MSEISKIEQNLIIKKIDNETVNIQIVNNDILISIVGQFDHNLKKLSKLKSIFYEVGISYYGRTIEEGKKIRFIDALKCIYSSFKYFFRWNFS